jgi:WD40 repeat protein
MSAPGGGSTPPPDQDLGDQGDHEYVEAGDEDDMYAPVFLGDGHGEVVADLDEEDDAPMSDSDDDEVDPATHPGVAEDMEDRDAAMGDEIVPPQDDSVAVIRSHGAPVFSCAWSPTSASTFATGGGDDVAMLHVVSELAGASEEDAGGAPTQKVTVTSTELKGHGDTVSSLNFNHDGSLLASGGLDGKACVWNVADGKCLQTLEGPGGGLEWTKWHPKGNVLLAGSEDFTAWMWNAGDGQLMQVFAGHSASVSCGGFAPDGKSIATGSFDGSCRVWAPRTGECTTLFMGHPYHDGPVTCLDFHPTSEGLMITGSEDNTARLISSVSKKVLGALVAHTETLECVGMSGDFPFAASGGIDTKLVVWDLNTLQPRNTLPHDKAVSALRWIPGTAMLYRYVFSRFFRLLSRFNSLFWVFPKLSSRFDSKFRTSNERASRGYQCRCVGGQQFAILKNGRLLRCIANPIRV